MTLLDRAIRVGRVPPVNRGLYWWRSSEEVLLLKPAGRTSKQFNLYLLDAATGRETSLDSFNQKDLPRVTGDEWRVGTHGVPGFKVVYWTPESALSPDGEWLLWFSGRTTWVAARLDGTMEREWEEEHSIPSSCCWLRDSKKWVQLVREYQRKRYKLVEVIIRPVVKRSSPRTTVIQVDDGLLIGLTRRNSILIHHGSSTHAASNVTLSEISLSPARPTREYKIGLARFGVVSQIALSKSGDKLAWILSGEQHSFPREYLFVVSGLDGNNIKELGWMSGRLEVSRSRPNQQKYFWPRSLQWLPDGDEISFVFKEQLYRLQVS